MFGIYDSDQKPDEWGFEPGLVEPEDWEWFWESAVGVFPMWEGAGNTYFDISANRYSQTFSGSPVWGAGPSGKEIDFSPSDAFSKSAVGSSLATRFQSKTEISITIYARASSYVNVKAGISIKQESDVSGSDSIVFYPYDTSGGDGARIFFNGVNLLNENTGALADGKNHLFTYSMFNSTEHRLFAEGVQVASSATSETISGNTDVVNIAAWDGSVVQSFHGQIAYIVVHARPLILSQHAQLARDSFGPFRMADEVVFGLPAGGIEGLAPPGSTQIELVI